MSASADEDEATVIAPPICGLLVPDFVEHALEVFDAAGKAIGQITTDRVRFDGNPGTAQRFSRSPSSRTRGSRARRRRLLPQERLLLIADPHLRALVESIVAQSQDIVIGEPPALSGSETGAQRDATGD